MRSLTLRDPDARLYDVDSRLIRILPASSAAPFRRMLGHPAVVAAMRSGLLVGARPLAALDVPTALATAVGAGVEAWEHERVGLVSYPAEWSPLMLCDAAICTLRVQAVALEAGCVLKDATPTNVLFRGNDAVFVDLPSLVDRPAGAYLWSARAQFDACFLMPLLLCIERGVPLSWSLRNPVAGVSYRQAARMLGAARWIDPALFVQVAVPAALTADSARPPAGKPGAQQLANDERAVFTLRRQNERLQARIEKLRRRLARSSSAWGDYVDTRTHYSSADLEAKRRFVAGVVEVVAPARTLDVGANTGEFSRIAARSGDVVALDVDPVAVDGIHVTGNGGEPGRGRINALVADVSRPTPAEGWRNLESAPLLRRLEAGFDLVLALAVMHHLRATSGIPMPEVVGQLARLTRRALVFEFVPLADPMFQAISRGRDALYADCARDSVEALLGEHFETRGRVDLPNGRTLYHLERRIAA